MKTDDEITVKTVNFPNGPSFAVWGNQTKTCLFRTRNRSTLDKWLVRNGWVSTTNGDK